MELKKDQILTDACGWCYSCETYHALQESDFYDCDECGQQVCEECINTDDEGKHVCDKCLNEMTDE